jgi:hypothetical protein
MSVVNLVDLMSSLCSVHEVNAQYRDICPSFRIFRVPNS